MFKIRLLNKVTLGVLLTSKFAFMTATEEMAHMNKLNGPIFILSAAGVMSNTVQSETSVPLAEMNCVEGVLTPGDDCLE